MELWNYRAAQFTPRLPRLTVQWKAQSDLIFLTRGPGPGPGGPVDGRAPVQKSNGQVTPTPFISRTRTRALPDYCTPSSSMTCSSLERLSPTGTSYFEVPLIYPGLYPLLLNIPPSFARFSDHPSPLPHSKSAGGSPHAGRTS
eukprot:752415-Hanusia_phi.AAC.1